MVSENEDENGIYTASQSKSNFTAKFWYNQCLTTKINFDMPKYSRRKIICSKTHKGGDTLLIFPLQCPGYLYLALNSNISPPHI